MPVGKINHQEKGEKDENQGEKVHQQNAQEQTPRVFPARKLLCNLIKHNAYPLKKKHGLRYLT